MSGNRILIDTNIIIYHLNGDLTLEVLLENKEIFISFISEIELRSQRVTHQSEQVINRFLYHVTVVHSNDKISFEASKLRKGKKLKTPDAIIAATTKTLGVPLLTADKAFTGIPTLDVIEYLPNPL
ncbi:MAG: type II toxin-antitoxin system VapC family toxin [Cyclobacteriaceae bacterium]|nr:type II toxin-antitoxin system VapC family toxin [Cyclobacteriaceae bacterium]